ncbi:MAG: hypothetical protein R3Y47_05820 [Lachnospiraceae bacterium]
MGIMIKYSLMVAFVPFIIMISLMFVNDLNTQLIIAIVGMVLTFISNMYGKKKVSFFIKPSDVMLEKMNMAPVVVEYIPNKFKISATIAEYLLHINILSSLFGYLTYKNSYIVPQPSGYDALIIDDGYLMLGVTCMMIGLMSFTGWVKLKQAYYIFSEIDDRRRYMLNAFAVHIQKRAQKASFYYNMAKVSNRLK